MSTDINDRVRHVFANEIAPALSMDGVDMEVLDVSAGVVRVRFTGMCGSCPSSVMSLVMMIEQELRRNVPEIEYLEAVP